MMPPSRERDVVKICPECKMRYPNEAAQCFVEGSRLDPLPDERIGTVVAGRYLIEEAIGEGGMATVYRARQKLADRQIAIKIMNPMLATDDVVRERFRREARSAQKLTHPNIIEIFDQGDTEDGTAYIAMELLRGESLATVIARGPLDVDRALRIMLQLARGIARAHDLEVIHRDVKPENIFLCRRDDGTDLVKLLDFGIAKSRQDSRLTGQGELFGTPQYMAPERILEKDAAAPSDLYALGVVFFEMLTGQLPFEAPDVARFFLKHLEEAPPLVRSRNPRAPEPLDDLVQRMLAKAPGNRPADAHAVHDALIAIMQDREALPPPPAGDDLVISVPPITLAAGPADPWARRVALLEQMLAHAFGDRARAPRELRALLDRANDLVREVAALRLESFRAQESLEHVDARGRDRRAQLGLEVDQLGVDASRARTELRGAREAQQTAEARAAEARARYQAAQKDALYWEGRCGFLEPTTDLADAYRAAAASVDEWLTLHRQARAAQAVADEADRVASELAVSLRELRGALTVHEQELDDARAARLGTIRAREAEADRLEAELHDVTAQFCTPLRARPELAPLFAELERDAA